MHVKTCNAPPATGNKPAPGSPAGDGFGSSWRPCSADLPIVRSVIAVDPSEAVRSAEIVPVLQRYFEIVEYKPLGGSILQFLLADIAGNFAQDEAGQRLLELLFAIEDALMAVGALESDFAYIIAAPGGRADQPCFLRRLCAI